MKKRMVLIGTSLLIVSALLTACGLTSSPTQSDPGTSSTLVALAFTQTAITEKEMQPTETEAVMATTEAPMAEVTDTPTVAPTEISHSMTPGEPGYITKWFYDTNSGRFRFFRRRDGWR